MFGSNFASSPSLADIAAVTDNNRGNNNGFGDNNGWWILIILFALFGWGRGGYGNGYGNGEPSVVYVPTGGMNGGLGAEVQRGFDTQSIINKLSGIDNGICSLGYDQLAQMNGINTNIMQTGYGIQNSITQMGIAQMQDTNAISRQLAECCCENRQGQADIKYAMATDTCAITTAINQAAQQIMQNDNANFRALSDRLTQQEIDRLKAQLAEKDLLINQLNLGISQRNQTEDIVSQLKTTCGCNCNCN